MTDHRIRLSDEDLDLIVAALRARAAMAGPIRAHRIERLAERLSELAPGNPQWRLSVPSQEHERTEPPRLSVIGRLTAPGPAPEP